MTPIRYTSLIMVFCLLAGIRTAQAQCSANAVATSVLCPGQNDGSIDLTASNGTPPYTYTWSNNETTEDLSSLTAGFYACTVTDNVGCTATTTAIVTEPQAITITISDVILNCAILSHTLDPLVSGGTPPYNYQWGTGASTQSIQVQVPGAYFLTVTDANGCTATKVPIVFKDVTVPTACAGPDQLLTCAALQVMLDASCSSIGTNFSHVWVGPGITPANQFLLNPTINIAGPYTITVTNTTNGCTATDIVVVTQDINFPTVSIDPDLEIPCGGGVITLPGIGPGGPNFTYSWTTTDGNIISGSNTLTPNVDQPGTYILTAVNNINGCTATLNVIVNDGVAGLCTTIEGRVLQDTLENCQTDTGEPALFGWIVQAQGVLGTFYALTDVNGDYEIFVASGDDYAVSAIAPSVLWETCPAIPLVSAINPSETYPANDLLFQRSANCPLLSVDISSGNLRRCFTNNHFSVSYCNNGTAPAENAYIDVSLDTLLTPLSSSIPFEDQGGNVFRFALGYIEIGECGQFNFLTELSCNAVIGQTHCTEAHIYPDVSCVPTEPQWSGASLKISPVCQSDSVRFTIKNIGVGNMLNMTDYIIMEDQVMLMSAPLQLDAGQSITVSVPANGSTWRMEVEQVPFHPGQSQPAVSVEGCTAAGSFSTGFVTMFPNDDADPFIDIDCRQNTGSYDPNDKQGFPIGYGSAHYIRPGTSLEYQIRFQNTGNDTAFTVRIVDTLSVWLDPSSIRPGASSHPYTWDLTGYGALSFLFENILLPDSNVNEPASHGFVKFTINPRTDAPLETNIENSAEIYFDFNEAIVTNTTFHRLGENFVTIGLWQPGQSSYEVLVSPNPFSDAAFLEVKGLQQNTSLHLQVFDLQGKLQLEMDSETAVFHLKKGDIPTGVYLFKIEQSGKGVGAGKLIIQD